MAVRVATSSSLYPRPKQKPHSAILLGSASVDSAPPAEWLGRASAAARDSQLLIQTPRPDREKDRRDRTVYGNAIVLLHCDTEAAGGFIDRSSSSCYEKVRRRGCPNHARRESSTNGPPTSTPEDMDIHWEETHATIVGSQGGAPTDPVWVHNLRVNPDVEIRDETVVRPMRAREVEDEDERSRLWKLAIAAYPPYAEYQERTARRIPVFVAERS